MKKNPSVDDNPPHVLILNCTPTVNDLHLGGGSFGGFCWKILRFRTWKPVAVVGGHTEHKSQRGLLRAL